ncbi:type IV secretory system conjugative DNA transfer family protein [Bosea eneae]|uniref:Type IV secretory system conjugative DNA transfer family protein n=1 Tax=Bosea eneae TaxID=151454 RepID=A0ABW0IUZ6_9HYPH
MTDPAVPFRVALAAAVGLLIAVLAFPAAFVLTHGFVLGGWPAGQTDPLRWFGAILNGEFPAIGAFLLNFLRGRVDALPLGGLAASWTAVALIVGSSAAIISGGKHVPLRDPSEQFGKAQWASSRVLRAMNKGLELGLNPDTGRAVRVRVEGNLVSIAPPRSGKTGLLLANLAVPEEGAWTGPAVVIDPKGTAYLAMRARREALGRTVHCIDPLGIVGGTARWNPLLHVDRSDTTALVSMARALLPAPKSSSEAGTYFRDRASILIAAAIFATLCDAKADVGAAADLMQNVDAFTRALGAGRSPLEQEAAATLATEPRVRDPILSTAGQGLQFLLDQRLRAAMIDHTLDLVELMHGDTDLFIVTPADDRREITAPYLRWLLSDLFVTIRKHRPAKRVMIFIDEAFVLGRFDAILKGVGELPGYGASIWTFWQSRAQLREAYGEDGARTIMETAEVVTVFNVPRHSGEEAEHWSQALGSFTTVAVSSAPGPNGKPQETRSAATQRLVTPDQIAELTRTNAIVFLTGAGHTSDPILVRKTQPHRDVRFAGMADWQKPVGAIDT